MNGRTKEEAAGLTLLGGQKTAYRSDYAPEVLETFAGGVITCSTDNPHIRVRLNGNDMRMSAADNKA